jgi:endonuclease/exonuclease/phosphatase family metal-dependent hydrolase
LAILNKTKRRTAVLLAIGLAVGLGVWHASLRVGMGPASGEGIEDLPSGARCAGSTFRVGTLNIASGRGRDGKVDLGRTAGVLEGLDLVALQEARGYVFRDDNQATVLARILRCGWLYAPTETRWYVKQFGNAVLSRLPVGRWERIPLPRQYDRSYRNAVSLVVEHEGRPIHVLATHLTQRDRRDREAQLKAVIELFLATEKPAILLGDLNLRPNSPALRELTARPDVDEPVGRLVKRPPEDRVCWIFVRGLRCVDAGVLDAGVSDHPLFWVELAWPGNADEK